MIHLGAPIGIGFFPITTTYTMDADLGAFALTGYDASLEYSGKLLINCDTGYFSLRGYSTILSYGFTSYDKMEPPPIKDGLFGKNDGIIKSDAWAQWFTGISEKPALSPPDNSEKILNGSGAWDYAKLRFYSSDDEPTLSSNNSVAIWKDTDDSDKIYLIFRRGSSDQVKIELT